MNYNDLKTKQQNYIQLLSQAYTGDATEDTTFKRAYLKQVANDNGIAWAPAWIVKDTARVRGRGEYVVPELAQYRASKVGATPVVVAEDVTTEENTAPVAECCVEQTAAADSGEPVRPEHIKPEVWGLMTDEEQAAAVAA